MPVKRKKLEEKADLRRVQFLAISRLDHSPLDIELITPSGIYHISDGRVMGTEGVSNYRKTVKDALASIAKRACYSCEGFYSGEYRIQFEGRNALTRR